MRSLLYYLLQVIVASGILYGYYHLALRNKKFHRYNRYYLLAATAVSITIPFLNIPVYFTQSETDSSFVLQTLTVISSVAPGTPSLTLIKPEDHASWWTWQNLSLLFYILIAALVLLRIIFSLFKIRRIVKANHVEQLDKIHFVNTTEPGTPFSFFRWLFWNKKIELRSEKGEQIFRHELFHIEQQHSSDIMYLELLTILLWINPFFHLIKKEVKAIHEFLADQFAVTENKKWEYAELLLMQVLNTHQQLVNPFFHNQIKRRIAMLTTSKKPGHQYLRKLMVFPVAAIVIGLFAFSYKNKEAKDLNESLEKAGINMSSDSDTLNPVVNQTLLTGNVTISHNSAIPSKIIINGKEITISKLTLEGFDTAKIVSAELYINTTAGFDTAKVVSGVLHINATAINISDTSSKPLVLLDGVKQASNNTDEILKSIDPSMIQSINVLKGNSAILKYGSMGENGAIEIFTKENKIPVTGLIKVDTTKPDKSDNKIFDKVEIEPSFPGGDTKWNQYQKIALNQLIPSQKGAPVGTYTVIVHFVVKKDGYITDVSALTNHGFGMEEEAIRLISKGPKWIPAMNGRQVNAYKNQPVTFVVGKKGSTLSSGPIDGDKVFQKVETPPSFPRGDTAWRRYLEKNVNGLIPVDSGAPAGKYTVIAQFIVEKDGTLSDIKALTKHGFGMENEVVRILKNGPKWIPATQNGKIVKAYTKQPVTFQIEEESGKLTTETQGQKAGNNTSNIPEISLAQLKKSAPVQLLQLPEGTEIISYKFTTDLSNGEIAEIQNTGNEFNTATKNHIQNTTPGRLITFDAIKIREKGQDKKIPGKVYAVTN